MKRVNRKQTLKQLEGKYLKINALRAKLLGEMSRLDKEHEMLISKRKELENQKKSNSDSGSKPDSPTEDFLNFFQDN